MENAPKQNPEIIIPSQEILLNDRETAIMPAAYEQSIALLKERAIDPESFVGKYDSELLEKCRKYVSNCEAIFEKNRQNNENGWQRAEMFGKTLEAIMNDTINKGIFGDDVRAATTAPYDDIYAGIDGVIERNAPEGTVHIGCALDYTFGNPSKKIASIRDTINGGRLHEIIFYRSPFGDPPNMEGRLPGIPKVVVGMDSNHLVDLSEQWLNNDTEGLQNNQLFLMILRQIQLQAEVYAEHAKKAQRLGIAEKYLQMGKAITSLYGEQKKRTGVSFLDPNINDDMVFREIKDGLSKLVELP